MNKTLLSAALSLLFTAVSFGQVPQAPQTTLKVGDLAPDFTLRDTEGNDVTLSSFRGKKNVVVAFYVLAFTGG